MCGFAGVINLDFRVINASDVFALLDHRGPDARGFIGEDIYQLWHTTLAVQSDTEVITQPLSDKKSILLFNGEIFNKEVDLFNSDTSFLFNELGTKKDLLDSFEELIGSFSICYIDKNSRKVTLSRDIFGSRPLFYYWRDGVLIFGSTIDVVIKLVPVKVSIDHKAILCFLERGHFEDDSTFFSEIKSVTPGSIIQFDIGECTAQVSRFKRKSKFDKYQESSLSSAFLQSLRRNIMQKNTALAPFLALSGGIDSQLIKEASSASSLVEVNYITGFHPFSKKEKVKGTMYLDVTFNLIQELEQAPEILYSGNPSVFFIKKMAEYVNNQGGKVLLTGTGADEYFGGYRRNISLKYPAIIRLINLIFGQKTATDKNLFGYFSKFFRLSEDYLSIIRHYKLVKRPAATWTYSKSIDYEKYVYLPNELCAVCDQGAMFASVESRSPFLDQAFCQQVEDERWDRTFLIWSKINLRLILAKYTKNILRSFLPKKGMTSELVITNKEIEKIIFFDKKLNLEIYSDAVKYVKDSNKNKLPVFLVYRLLVVGYALERSR